MKNKLMTFIALASISTPLMAGLNSTIFLDPTPIPAVGQAGLIALAFVVGLIGAQLIRKRRSGGN